MILLLVLFDISHVSVVDESNILLWSSEFGRLAFMAFRDWEERFTIIIKWIKIDR